MHLYIAGLFLCLCIMYVDVLAILDINVCDRYVHVYMVYMFVARISPYLCICHFSRVCISSMCSIFKACHIDVYNINPVSILLYVFI